MTQTLRKSKEIEDYYHQHLEKLHEIQTELKKLIRNKRQITYSDIINYLIKQDYKGENYTQIILWCNHNIRKGNFFIEF